MANSTEVIGIVPAGGWARRLSPLPCSKEIYPIGMHGGTNGSAARPKVAAHYLLEKMRRADVERAFVILRDGKWDIPGYFANGDEVGMHLAYLVTRRPYGPPFTIDEAYPFVRDARIAFGFPDILFEPGDVFEPLLERQQTSGAAVVLAVFPVQDYEHHHLVDMDGAGRITEVLLTRDRTTSRYSWVAAVWSHEFTSFLHRFVVDQLNEIRLSGSTQEWHVPDVIQAAIDEGMHVDSVVFEGGTYLDIGTPENLERANQYANIF